LTPRAAWITAISAAVVLVAAVAGIVYNFGTLRDRARLVTDEAGLIGQTAIRDIEAQHHFLNIDYSIDYRVVVHDQTGDINLFAARQFEDLRVGANTQDGRGLLLVIDRAQDEVRLEVGYALEGIFPDAFIGYVQQRQMVPFFQANKIGDGVLATTELIVDRAIKADLQADIAGEIWLQGSGGGGAATAARIGAGGDISASTNDSELAPAATPQGTLDQYFQVMARRDANPDLSIYTAESQQMLAGWTVTPAQMDHLVSTYRGCRLDATQINTAGKLAVIRYAIDDRVCAPFFFRKVADLWRLDLTMMQSAIRFGRSNAWHFVPGKPHPYTFAFTDWSFDRHGFPQR